MEDPRAWREVLVARAAARLEVWHREAGAARAAAETAVDALLQGSELHLIGIAGREQGWCWIGPRGRDLGVRDLDLTSLAVAEVRDWLCEHARDSGLVGMRASARPELPVSGALVDDPRFSVFSTNMRPVADRGAAHTRAAGADVEAGVRRLRLVALHGGVHRGSDRRRRASRRGAPGRRGADGEAAARGPATPEQHLFVAVLDGAEAGAALAVDGLRGALRLRRRDPRGAPRARPRPGADGRRGGLVRGDGAPALGLNVFGHNARARALYDSLGYRVVEDACRADLG